MKGLKVPFSAIRFLITKCGVRLETSLFSWPKEATKSIEADSIDPINSSTSPTNGSRSGAIHVSTGASLSKRDLLPSPRVSINGTTPRARLDVAIQYDSWFNSVDIAAL